MVERPQPIQTWRIGDSGKNIVTMGLYAYIALDDVDPRKVVTRGYVCCPVLAADNAMRGLYDPEQYSRTGFSQNKEPGAAAAVLTGADKPDNLTEEQRNMARSFLQAMEDRMTVLAGEERFAAKDIAVLRKHPNDLLEPTEWDKQTNTVLYTQYPVAVRTEILDGFAPAIVQAADSTAKLFQRPASAGEQLVQKIEVKRERAWADKPAATQSQESVAPTISPKEQARILAALGSALLHEFPDESHAAARNKVFERMRTVLKGEKGTDAGDIPH